MLGTIVCPHIPRTPTPPPERHMPPPTQDPQAADPADPLVGQVIAGQFHIEKLLGSGGMGAVYLAEQTDMGRKVVIKVMHPELTAGSPQAVERFKREARAVAALNHPHIVQVYVFGQADDGRMYLAMEFIEGADLGHAIAQHPLDQARALRILDQTASALIEAHSRGVVHRDLKPENIMLTHRHGNEDWVKVLDFGIAKVGTQEGAAALTQAGAIFGTPKYMAPEQVQGGEVDARTDLYALGVILHEMLTGDHPFRANSAIDYLVKHVNEAIVPPSQRSPELGIVPRVEGVLMRLLAKDPADRFQSAAELQREVRASLAEIGDPLSHTLSLSRQAVAAAVRQSEYAATVTSAPEGPPLKVAKKKSALPWIAAGVLLLGGGAAATVALGGSAEPKPQVLLAAQPSPEGGGVQNSPPNTPVEPAVVPADGADVAIAAGAVDASATLVAAVEDTTAPTDAEPAEADASALAQVEPTGPLHRALQDVEGFPVPEGTTLLDAGELYLRLESTAPAAALMDFYEQVLQGRVSRVASGFDVTDRKFPFTSIHLTPDGERVGIQVGRRAVAVAKPKVVTPPTPTPAPTPEPVVTPEPTPTTDPTTGPLTRRPGRRPVPSEPTTPTNPTVTDPTVNPTAPVPGRRRPPRVQPDTQPTDPPPRIRRVRP